MDVAASTSIETYRQGTTVTATTGNKNVTDDELVRTHKTMSSQLPGRDTESELPRTSSGTVHGISPALTIVAQTGRYRNH